LLVKPNTNHRTLHHPRPDEVPVPPACCRLTRPAEVPVSNRVGSRRRPRCHTERSPHRDRAGPATRLGSALSAPTHCYGRDAAKLFAGLRPRFNARPAAKCPLGPVVSPAGPADCHVPGAAESSRRMLSRSADHRSPHRPCRRTPVVGCSPVLPAGAALPRRPRPSVRSPSHPAVEGCSDEVSGPGDAGRLIL
jgi:hypothetical protein